MDALATLDVPIAVKETVRFQRERLRDVRAECAGIIERHYQEIALQKQAQKLDPDWDQYEGLERSGRLWLMTARHRGRLVGYIVMLISTHLHYKTLTVALEDIHYLDPEYRKGLTGFKMIKLAVAEMQRIGVKKCVLRTKLFKPHGLLFERLGFVPEDEVWSKILED